MKARLLAVLIVVCSSIGVAQCPKGDDSCTTTVTSESGRGTETSTTYDNKAHSEAVAASTANVTNSTLTYLLLTRPEMLKARNESVNQLEGRFTPVYRMLDSLEVNDVPVHVVVARQTATVKGHQLGETWQEFLAKAPLLKERFDACANEKRLDLIRKQRKTVFNPCADMWRMHDNPSSSLTLDCRDAGKAVSKEMFCRDLDGEISFDSGRLVSLKVMLAGDWTEVLSDIIAKFGPANGRNSDATLGVWKTNQYEVVGVETGYGPALAWITPERYEEAARDRKMPSTEAAPERSSSLD